jgi:hypothetical protein
MSSLTPRIDRMEKNYIINGDMRIAQRGTSFAAIANSAYCLDRWSYNKVGATVHTVTQDTDVPTFAQANYLFQNSLRLNLTTPDTSIAATDFCFMAQFIEGYNWANLAQKQFTVSFWVKATTTGTYCVGVKNSGNDRSYVAEYTINASATWEYKTITVAASPSAGTWNYSSGVGLAVYFVLAAGATYQTTPGSWQTGNFFATANQVNGVNTGATDFRITGVSVAEGTSTNTKFSTYARDFASELNTCKRYYQQMSSGIVGQVFSSTQMHMGMSFPVQMRALPTTSWVSTPTIVAPGRATYTPSSTTLLTNTATVNGVYIEMNNFTGMIANDGLYWISGGFFQADAEL